MTRKEAARMIRDSTTQAELGRAYRAYIGRRRYYCVLGPEYFGCCNTGNRAKISSRSDSIYVYIELHPGQAEYYPASDRKRAIAAFVRLAWQAQQYNLRQRAEVQRAREQLRAGSPEEQLGAMFALADAGA